MGTVVEDGEGDGGEGAGAGEDDGEGVEGGGRLVVGPVVVWGGRVVPEEAVDHLEGVVVGGVAICGVGYVRADVGETVGRVGVGEDVDVG